MKNQLKSAFVHIHAEADLKEKTEISVLNKLRDAEVVQKKSYLPKIAYASVFLIFLLVGFQWLYFTQTALISIDINPSLELGVNRFDRIISVKGLNEDGEELTRNLNLFNKKSKEALEELVEDKTIEKLESDGEELTITVSSKNDNQSKTILNQAEECTHGIENSSCHSITVGEAEEAKKLGLSCGKYRAYLELKQYEPDITPEEVSTMTMREIRSRINTYKNPQEEVNVSSQEMNCQNSSGNGGHRHHHGNE